MAVTTEAPPHCQIHNFLLPSTVPLYPKFNNLIKIRGINFVNVWGIELALVADLVNGGSPNNKSVKPPTVHMHQAEEEEVYVRVLL